MQPEIATVQCDAAVLFATGRPPCLMPSTERDIAENAHFPELSGRVARKASERIAEIEQSTVSAAFLRRAG